MALPNLAALFQLLPQAAAKFLADKGIRITGPYWELDGPLHSQVFTVANLAKLDVLTDIKAAVQKAIDAGKTERWFRGELIDTLRRKGWWGPAVAVDPITQEARLVQQGSLRRLQTIYRTNLQSSYMAGRHRQAMEQIDRAPFVQYLAVMDSRVRPAHAAMNGKVFRLDSPAWAIIAPPNGYNCRCRFRNLSQRELDKRGLRLAEDVRILERDPPGQRPVDPLTGATPGRWIQRGVSVPDPLDPAGGRKILWADPGWDNLPGSDGAERALVDALMARATELGEGVREAVVAGFAAQAAPAVAAPLVRGLAEYIRDGGATVDELIRQVRPGGGTPIFTDELKDFQKALLDLLARERGIDAPARVMGSGEGAKAVREASKLYPDSWTAAADRLGDLHVRKANGRGFAWTAPMDGRFRLSIFGAVDAKSGEGWIVVNGRQTNAVHEYAHRLQSALPELDRIFQELHQRRTAGDPLERLRDLRPGSNYDAAEVTRRDKYVNPYQGKEYGSPGALEVMTMAFEHVLGNNTWLLADFFGNDREMLDLVVGLLRYWEP